MISVSVVSHGHGAQVDALVGDLARVCAGPLELLVTLNVAEQHALFQERFPLVVIENPVPKGFGANHNAALARARGEYFCVINPDVRLAADPFAALVERMADARIGVCAPRVLDPQGRVEDSARNFPTPLEILAKAMGRAPALPGGATPDWVAGIFMLFRTAVLREAGGFDERYHMYYEDVDLCARLRLAGLEVALCPAVSVTHDARRASHRNARHLAWHLQSMARFFTSAPYREIARRRAAGRA